jgi:hypothetical protein
MKLVIAPRYNTGDKHDATGAFQPEAMKFSLVHGETRSIRLFDNSKTMPARFAEVMGWLSNCAPRSVDALAVFCHGFKTGLQVGATLANADKLAAELQRVCSPAPRIIMYACDAARDVDNDRIDDLDPGPGGEGGFADRLRDELVKRGVMATIYAHPTTAHATMNPCVRRFDPDDLAGGRWIVVPHSAKWRTWKLALRDTTLRFRYPFMSQAEIESELALPGIV